MGRNAIQLPPDADEATKLLGLAIRAARIERGWTQDDLASAIATTRRTISAIEQGKPSTSIGIVFAAATKLGLPLFNLDTSAVTQALRSASTINSLLPSRAINPSRKVPDERDF